MSAAWVAGVDGCRAGWIVALRPLAGPGDLALRLVGTFAEVLVLPEMPEVIAVDIPIGLPERSGVGGRPADVAARSRLGYRQSCVFAVPSRAAVMELDYRRSCEIARATSDPPRMVSKQTYHLFGKIREVDALMTPRVQTRVFEVHPELAFWAMNGERPLSEPKKVKSRPYAPGLDLRRALLAGAGYDVARLDAFLIRAKQAGRDDVLDAAANSWTAARIANGVARRFPAEPELDARGLRMEIWG